jgi:predicted metal-dependent HD superfamily phosphohydrolase
MNLENKLATRWTSLCKRINAEGDYMKIFENIVVSYTELHRYYHNLEHIYECSIDFDEVKHLIYLPNEVEMALFQHDRICNPLSLFNEQLSSELAYKEARSEMKLSLSFSRNDKRLILPTDPKSRPQENDEMYVSDIDKAILGKSELVFDKYDQNIRKEYSLVPEELYNKKRIKVLSKLKKPFLTKYFVDKYSQQTEINIERAISKLIS